MNRRDFLVQSSRLAAATALNGQQMFGDANGPSSQTGEVRLEDDEILIAFDAGSGALIRLERKSTGWVLQRRPELGVSFRLLAPLPHRRDNFVLGQKQHDVEVKKLSDHQVRLQWKNLVSEHGGTLPPCSLKKY